MLLRTFFPKMSTHCLLLTRKNIQYLCLMIIFIHIILHLCQKNSNHSFGKYPAPSISPSLIHSQNTALSVSLPNGLTDISRLTCPKHNSKSVSLLPGNLLVLFLLYELQIFFLFTVFDLAMVFEFLGLKKHPYSRLTK